MFDGVFDSPELARTLTRLTLCLVYDGTGPEPSSSWPVSVIDVVEVGTDPPPCPWWDDLLAKMCSSLEPRHNLTHPRIVIHSNTAEEEDADDSISFAHALRRCGSDNELGEGGNVAASLVRAVPSLQYVFLTTNGYLPVPEGRRTAGWLYVEVYGPKYEG